MTEKLFVHTHTLDLTSKSYIVFDNLVSSWGGDYEYCDNVTDDKNPWLLWGLVNQNPEMMLKFEAQNMLYYYSDMGYFYRKTPQMAVENSYWRVTKNAFVNYRFKDRPSDRWDNLKIDLNDWQQTNRDKHILVCDVSYAHKRYYSDISWLDNTLSKLLRLTGRPIITRYKPGQKERDAGSPGFKELLKNAHAVVTLSSQAAVEAAIAGVPCFVHEKSHAASLGCTDISRIESPEYPDRRPGLYHIAYSQFTPEELRNGYAWDIVND